MGILHFVQDDIILLWLTMILEHFVFTRVADSLPPKMRGFIIQAFLIFMPPSTGSTAPLV